MKLRSEGKREPGAELAAQRRALAAACRRRGWQPVELRADPRLPAQGGKRPGRAQAQRLLERGEAQALAVAKRETPAQALLELAALLARAQQQGFALIALDCEPPRPAGEASAHLLATFAPFERGLHSQRIRVGLAQARAQGVRLGRPPRMAPYVLERIRRERAAGRSLAAIADGLNADRIPTAQGGRRWYPSTVRYALSRAR